MNKMDLVTQLAPPQIKDDCMKVLTIDHLKFVGRSAQDVADWRARRAALGMKPALYRDFCNELFQAVKKDGLEDFDIRLKGSAACIFSGPHKQLPSSQDEIKKELVKHIYDTTGISYDPPMEKLEIVMGILEELKPLPMRRPFDFMFKLGIGELSDYDVQLSSDQVLKRCKGLVEKEPKYKEHQKLAPLINSNYGFISDVYVRNVLAYIPLWEDKWSEKLQRDVNLKVFPRKGPPEVTSPNKALSSHLQDHDWILTAPIKGED